MIQNPKRSADSKSKNNYWYDYYAGYSESFTISALQSAKLPINATILDPWNGAGTTTNSCSKLGLKSLGFDLNPVMVIIAKANQANDDEIRLAFQNNKLLSRRYKSEPNIQDPLLLWLTPCSIEHIRKIEKFILKGKTYDSLLKKSEALTTSQCVQYVALFNTLRSFLDKFIPSNPTWIKKASSNEEKIDLSWEQIKSAYLINSSKMSESLINSSTNSHIQHPTLKTGTSTDLPVKSETIDLILSSPPYCTRIDYAIATLPELAILSVKGEKEIDSLRRTLMGATTVPKAVPSNISFGKVCDHFLLKVKQHSSTASSTYYYKNFFQYFLELSLSMKEIARVLKYKGKCYLVVQDSYYKDIHCDLAKIIVDMCTSLGLKHISTNTFYSKNNMANINPKGKKYRIKTEAIESVIELRKVE
ncbi:TRM11 family methyltransferase [Aliivibrio fischeri]|uniref:hypothetical protein n=1 Tax=Aliivibrio fischeri TaxID=668 RepID=UPI0012D98482|nr:hypothetical protein [Aliivibrio fischeri]MUH97618.1 hypothetical protein [Aliivibrio fischeri]MUI65653.1 hypothetical protein [Aliivibrio fischeri]USR95417.1 hypothetical protein AVFI_13165 [Aliivibrio fischeri ATCC 7744 = JCM 18803 = DSM 507]GGK43720.1 hypothetical protein GCM10007987_28810 [Aliivibrio fischeri]